MRKLTALARRLLPRGRLSSRAGRPKPRHAKDLMVRPSFACLADEVGRRVIYQYPGIVLLKKQSSLREGVRFGHGQRFPAPKFGQWPGIAEKGRLAGHIGHLFFT